MNPRVASVVLVSALLGSGCSTTLSSLQTAKTVPTGAVQAHVGMGAFVNTGPIATGLGVAIDEAQAAKAAQERGEPYVLSEEQKARLFVAGVGLAVLPPSTGWEVGLRTGIINERLDVGFRYSGNAVRLDTKWRFLHRGTEAGAKSGVSYDLAAGVGVARYLFKHPATDLIESLKLGEFSRWDLEVPVYASVEINEIFTAYIVPKYVVGRTQIEGAILQISDEAGALLDVQADLPAEIYSHFGGATLGLGLGYRYVYVMGELTIGYTSCRPELMGGPRELGGVTLYPAIGLMVKTK